jgi:hypothetical protein
MACCQSGVSRMRCLKDDLGGTHRIPCRGSAQSSAGWEILVFLGGSLLTCPGGREGLVPLHWNRSLQQTSMLKGDEHGFVNKVS